MIVSQFILCPVSFVYIIYKYINYCYNQYTFPNSVIYLCASFYWISMMFQLEFMDDFIGWFVLTFSLDCFSCSISFKKIDLYLFLSNYQWYIAHSLAPMLSSPVSFLPSVVLKANRCANIYFLLRQVADLNILNEISQVRYTIKLSCSSF